MRCLPTLIISVCVRVCVCLTLSVCLSVCVWYSVVLVVELVWQVLGVVCLIRHYATCHSRAAMRALLGMFTIVAHH